jgi:ubiquinone/menaquinone biosynthesis C-methylase UbiE
MKMTSIEKRFVNGPARRAVIAAHVTTLLEQVPVAPDGRLLDVGCGVGAAACAVADRWGLQVVGVDIDPAQIEAARGSTKLPNLSFEVMDATDLKFSDGEFDIVVSSMATHHVPRWETALAEMARVLRPGGYLAYIDFVFPQWLSRAGRVFGPLMALPSSRGIESLTARAGLVKSYQHRSGMQLHAVFRKTS